MKPAIAIQPLVMALVMGYLAVGSLSFGQEDLVWTGLGDGTTFSDAGNWEGGVLPDLQFLGDSLKFPSGTSGTLNNDLDPATNPVTPGNPLELGLGTGTSATSGAFHFQVGSGDFTFDGFPVFIGPSSGAGVHTTLLRADAGAGTTQTFNIDMNFGVGGHERRLAMLNNGTAIFNGSINFRGNQIFIDEARATVVLNGANTGNGRANAMSYAANGPTGNRADAPLRVQGNGVNAETQIVLGNAAALGNASSGSWTTGDLRFSSFQAIRESYVSTSSALDLSQYGFLLQSGGGVPGGAVNYRSSFDSTIGWVANIAGNRDIKVGDVGKLTVAGGVFMSQDTTARQLNINLAGSSGNVPGANGQLVVNGPLYNTFIDPITSANNGTSALGGIVAQRAGVGGVMVNGTVRVNWGTITLNGDSNSTWIGSEYRALNGSITIVGHDNAFGDSTSVVTLENGNSIIDIGNHTIAQRFTSTNGTLRGAGTLTNPDWSNIVGTVQPGGATPTASDTLTFNFSAAGAANTMVFQTASQVRFALGAGLTSSQIDVVGSTGGTLVALDNNTFNFTDLTGGSLSVGTYTLFDGDANTTYSLGASVTLNGLGGMSGGLSVSGDDLVLNLAAGTPGDFDGDGDVDGRDFLVWQRGGSPNPLSAGDLADWQTNYGTPPLTATITSVPEPSVVLFTFCGLAACGMRRRVS